MLDKAFTPGIFRDSQLSSSDSKPAFTALPVVRVEQEAPTTKIMIKMINLATNEFILIIHISSI